MVMEPAQSVDVDRAVIHPHTLNHVGGSGRSLGEKCALVDQIEYVVHLLKVLSLLFGYAVRPCSSDEFAGSGQPIVAVSEKSLRALERSFRRVSFELVRSG